jgi:hypothetical protein
MNVTIDRTAEIKKELSELNQSLKMSVQKAIKIGQLLTEQKEFIGHGNFLSWIEDNIDIGQVTAHKYINLYYHQNKISLSENLQEAYSQIETIERQEKQSNEERKRSLIAEFRKTGKKPEGWNRDCDYVIQKDKENEIRQAEYKKQLEQERQENIRKREQEKLTDDLFSQTLNNASNQFIKQVTERKQWQDKIRISDSGKEDAFNQAIMDYMETLPDDNRRIEACNNIIKICKNISIELQRKK